MDKPCSNCGKVIAETGRLTRVNKKGVKGVWACPECIGFDEEDVEYAGSNEVKDAVAIYVHKADCPGFCDFACNGKWGEQLADYVNRTNPTTGGADNG